MPPPSRGVDPPPPPVLPLRARLVAAAGASVASAVVVTPLDVVKTRLQAAASAGLRAPTGAPVLSLAGVGCPAPAPPAPAARAAAVARSIVAAEGVRGLWRGTNYALLMSVPMVGVYMPLYDEALAALNGGGTATTSPLAPALAGAAARAAAALATAPLELARTRSQAPLTPAGARLPPLPAPGAGAGLAGAARAAWSGTGATLARDVPFSALYWALLEPVRAAVLGGVGGAGGASSPSPPPSSAVVALTNLVAGAAAGAAAAAATTPLDVVKTKVQLEACGRAAVPGVAATLREVYASRGVAGLFAGVGPRSARAAPACAIVVAAYELLKATVGGGVGEVGGLEGEVTAAVDH